ncbi:hypothetical protein LCGC14_0371750 [marine sediment metagenome]|uniref:Uncharacterized protein n=1 Tax=marine sediment metagenome TaxID=412755 RepID=A0A0F9WDN3_9ZZZZ
MDKKEEKEEKEEEFKGASPASKEELDLWKAEEKKYMEENELWAGANANDAFEKEFVSPLPLTVKKTLERMEARRIKEIESKNRVIKLADDQIRQLTNENESLKKEVSFGGGEYAEKEYNEIPREIKANRPMQAYSYRMGDANPLEDMMWGILERIGFLPVYHANSVKEICFELGKIHQKYIAELQKYVDKKGEAFMEKEENLENYDFSIVADGKPMSGKSYALSLIDKYLITHGYKTLFSPGKTVKNEHRLLVKVTERMKKEEPMKDNIKNELLEELNTSPLITVKEITPEEVKEAMKEAIRTKVPIFKVKEKKEDPNKQETSGETPK